MAGRASGAQLTTDHWPLPTPLVGRETESAQLHEWLEKALHGERQIVFVTGEPGIGKTTLVDAFLTRLATAHEHDHEHGLRIGRGQCIEHYGTGEPYLPVLEALGRLCREPDGQRLIERLSQHAPTWLVQMPALLSAAELKALQRKTAGATKERMLRELAEAMERLTAERGLVLWFEDLHWSDVSTLDWLAFLARRREPAQLLLLGTYRPVEVIVSAHPLKTVKQELQLHGQCAELPLRLLRKDDVEAYLAKRFTVGAIHESPLRRLTHLIHQRTDGNPLFMITVIDYLMAQGVLVQSEGQWTVPGEVAMTEAGVPASLQELIERQLERLSAKEQRLLEVASVAGVEFSAAAVAAGVGAAAEAVEEQCVELARRGQFVQASGTAEWPDGTVAARYSFLHALYQEVLYDRLTAGRRQRLHQQIGEREEAAYSERAREIAAELAMHFERGRNYPKAVQYLQHAGENASRRSAYQEAISLFTKGLELLKTLPDTPERTPQELTLQIALAYPVQFTRGFAAPELEKVYARARELYQQIGETPQLIGVLSGLQGYYMLRAELKTARELGEQLLTQAQSTQSPARLTFAHHVLGATCFWLGELASTQAHLEQHSALYNRQQCRSRGVWEPVVRLSYAARVLWLLGYPDQALNKSHEALTLAREFPHPFSLAYAFGFAAAWLHNLRREGQAAQEWAEAAITLSTEHGFALIVAVGTWLRGWALAEQRQREEGIAQMRQGLAAWQATGTELSRPYILALLAEAYGKVGQADEGLNALTEALATVNKTGERVHEAELYRLKGELLLAQEGSRPQAIGQREKTEESSRRQAIGYREKTEEAEACFQKAIEITRKQQAKSLELRATVSLARLWQQQGKKKQAQKTLSEIYNWFTEGFDTKDLQEAKTLLEELTSRRE